MTQFFDTVVDIYDETRGLPKDTMRAVIDAMVDELKDCKKVLEIGIGTGRFAEPLQRRGISIMGIDISPAMIEKARSKGLVNLVMGDVRSLPFKSSSFDSIISVHVLHLIENCDAALREMKRVASGELLSVLYKRSDFGVIEEYKAALNKCGYTLKQPGVCESAIKNMVTPIREVQIEPFKEIHTIRKRLELLAERKHSYTYSAPAKAHECAIEYLRDKYADELDSHYSSDIEVVVWNIADLPESFPLDYQ